MQNRKTRINRVRATAWTSLKVTDVFIKAVDYIHSSRVIYTIWLQIWIEIIVFFAITEECQIGH